MLDNVFYICYTGITKGSEKMKKRVILAIADSKTHVYTYTKRSLTLLDTLKDYYKSIVVYETKNNLVFVPTKKIK